MAGRSAFRAFLPILLLLLLALPPFLRAQQQLECNSCGSTLLRSQWQATGLPTIPPPERFHFDDECEDNTKNSPKVNCSSICMEMLLVAGGEYTVVRGCLSDFYEHYKLPNLAPTCYYADYEQELTMYQNNEPRQLKRVYVGTSYCNTNNCNTELKGDIGFATQYSSWQATKFCSVEYRQSSQLYECLDCARFDSNGDCDWNYRRYCNGQWCTKTIGYVNGRWIEQRGCAPINPLANSICVKLESTHQISQLSNHHLDLPYSLEQCFCQGGRCNGAAAQQQQHVVGALMMAMAICHPLLLLLWSATAAAVLIIPNPIV